MTLSAEEAAAGNPRQDGWALRPDRDQCTSQSSLAIGRPGVPRLESLRFVRAGVGVCKGRGPLIRVGHQGADSGHHRLRGTRGSRSSVARLLHEVGARKDRSSGPA
jgi:hypothetical protein